MTQGLTTLLKIQWHPKKGQNLWIWISLISPPGSNLPLFKYELLKAAGLGAGSSGAGEGGRHKDRPVLQVVLPAPWLPEGSPVEGGGLAQVGWERVARAALWSKPMAAALCRPGVSPRGRRCSQTLLSCSTALGHILHGAGGHRWMF